MFICKLIRKCCYLPVSNPGVFIRKHQKCCPTPNVAFYLTSDYCCLWVWLYKTLWFKRVIVYVSRIKRCKYRSNYELKIYTSNGFASVIFKKGFLAWYVSQWSCHRKCRVVVVVQMLFLNLINFVPSYLRFDTLWKSIIWIIFCVDLQ